MGNETRDADLSLYWVSLAAMRKAIQQTTVRPKFAAGRRRG